MSFDNNLKKQQNNCLLADKNKIQNFYREKQTDEFLLFKYKKIKTITNIY